MPSNIMEEEIFRSHLFTFEQLPAPPFPGDWSPMERGYRYLKSALSFLFLFFPKKEIEIRKWMFRLISNNVLLVSWTLLLQAKSSKGQGNLDVTWMELFVMSRMWKC